jgi:tRNA threonylcarbamoyl adenosine modification protein (Sua5/YciO/YrdC/YwlC family)
MTDFIKVSPLKPEEKKLVEIAECLNTGGVVIYPTDSIYAIGCSILSKEAIERIAKIKGIRQEKATFSMLVGDLNHITDYTRPMSTPVYKLMKKCLPGPFTFILSANSNVSRMMNSRRKTIGVRIPDNAVILGIIRHTGNPMVSTTLHDEDEIVKFPTNPYEIYEKYKGKVDMVVNGGIGKNEETTVIDCTGDEPAVIRQGLGII